jgi:hypothetical protein
LIVVACSLTLAMGCAGYGPTFEPEPSAGMASAASRTDLTFYFANAPPWPARRIGQLRVPSGSFGVSDVVRILLHLASKSGCEAVANLRFSWPPDEGLGVYVADCFVHDRNAATSAP